MQYAVKAALTSRKEVAKNTIELSFLPQDDTFTFKAGQYVWVEINLLYPDTRGSRRAFSICSSPSKKEITIVFRKSESGYKKTLSEMLIGTEITLHGPFGFLSLPQDTTRPVVFLAGGVGIAPFMSIITHEIETNCQRPITLLYANASEERIAYREELQQLKEKNPHFTFFIVLGKLTSDFIKQNTQSLSNPLWYIIDSKPFVIDVSQMLFTIGITGENMVFEEFYPHDPSEDVLNHAIIADQKINIFKLALENSSNHSVITDVNGTIVYANKAAEDITGYSVEEMKGQTPRLWGGMLDFETYQNLWKTIKIDRKPYISEIKNRRKNGEVYTTLARISPIIDSTGQLIGFIGSEEDITKRVKAEEELQRSHDFLNAIIDNLPIMVFVKDAKDLRFLFFNKTGETLLGHTKKDMLGKNDYDFFPKDQADHFIQKDREVLQNKTLLDIPEEPIDTKNKGQRTLHTKKIPLLDAQGNAIALLGISEDITEQKSILDNLKQRTDDLEKMNKVMVGRELKMVELKEEIEKLQGGRH